jgi:hypothetical protein
MLDDPAATDMLQNGLSIFENIGIVEPEVGDQIISMPQANWQFW